MLCSCKVSRVFTKQSACKWAWLAEQSCSYDSEKKEVALSGGIKACVTKFLSHQRIKLLSVFCGVNHRSLKPKSISTCDLFFGGELRNNEF